MIKLYGTLEQEQVVYSPARFIGNFWGRRGGKTIGFRLRSNRQCCENPGYRYLYLAPTVSHCRKQHSAMIDNANFRMLIASYRKGNEPEIHFKNGSVIEFRNARNPDNLRGNEYDEIWIDEIQHPLFNEEMYWEIIRPLVGATQGNIIVSGQFRGYNWFYYNFYEAGQKDTTGMYWSCKYPSSVGLMFQSDRGKAELKEIEEKTPRKIWRQEWLCEPDNNLNAVFDLEHYRNLLVKLSEVQLKQWCEPKQDKAYIMAIDLGGKVDYEAVVILEVDPFTVQKGPTRVVYADVFPRGIDHSVMAVRCAALATKYNAKVIMDSTGGSTGGQAKYDSYTQLYHGQMPSLMPFYWGYQNKDRVVKQVSLDIEQENFLIPEKFSGLNEQMQQYEFTYNKGSGFYRYGAPKNKHDDLAMALMLALWARYIQHYDKRDPNSCNAFGLLQ